MINKTFSCKIEDLPVIGEFLLGSLTKDLSDFSAYSPMFTADYPASIRVKIDACKNLISSSTITRELKATTQALYGKSKNLRGTLNTLEGYLKLAGQELDVAVDDTGLKSVRNDISRHNTEGLELNLRRMLTAVKRNMEVLTAKGLRRELIDEIEVRLEEIGELNVKQNVQTSERNRLTQSNIEMFNDLWSSLQPVVNTAKAIYRGVDDVKLKDYTVAQLLRRINAKKRGKAVEN